MTDRTAPPPVLPVNPIPPVVVVLFLAVAGIEAVLSLADGGMLGGATGIGWRVAAVGDWGFSPAVWHQVVDRGDWSLGMLQRFVTYGFVHANFTQALFGGVMVLALGKFVGEAFHWAATLAVFVVSLAVGAAVYGAVLAENVPLIGCYPGVYGLIGAFSYILWLRLGRSGQNQLRAFRLIGMLLGLQLLFAVLFGSQPSWIANLTGFATGFALSLLVAPGGFAGFLTRVRAR